jgi:hypothetical protein
MRYRDGPSCVSLADFLLGNLVSFTSNDLNGIPYS